MEVVFVVYFVFVEVVVYVVLFDKGEDDVKVIVILYQDVNLSFEELFYWVIELVFYYVLLCYIEFCDSLLKNLQGCVLKYQLCDEGKMVDIWDLEDIDIKVVKK